MRIFAEIDAEQLLSAQLNRAKSEVEKLDEETLLQVEDDNYALQILSRVRIAPLQFRFDDTHISVREEMIPAEQHPTYCFFVEPGESYLRKVVRYHLPFDGNATLLGCIPNPGIMWSIDVDVGNKEIAFDIISWNEDADAVKKEAEQVIEKIREQIGHLSKQVDDFNISAQSQIVQLLSNRRKKLEKDSDFASALGLPVKQPEIIQTPSTNLELAPQRDSQSPGEHISSVSWDVFISHASEDKEAFVRDLAQTLADKGLRVWYDEFTLSLGDSLRRSIDQGLANSRFGIVVLSRSFFSKEWPQRELDGLVSKELVSGKLILPIWHNVTKEDVAAYSPILADRLAVSSQKGLELVVEEVLSAINKKG